MIDSKAQCSGYDPAPLLRPSSTPVPDATVALKFVWAGDPLNVDRRDALYAHLAWCAVASPNPCNVTKLISVGDGSSGSQAFWAWAGWYDAASFMTSGATPETPSILSFNCSGSN